ncbi:GntR family transcriptional regulator [Brevibacillus dissolubilis]|uniref:GntR family transcriptional regulator n=1 Tax=Brevibacillus dissolubilis TaxID=1844116 RepID=UPI00111690BF|nr:GntR family transcriptional regulator [Brevibacillus dissolubilis]
MPIPTNYSAHVRVSARDHAFKQIQEWIIDGTFQPGEKLNDGKLAEALGISRTPVREALQTLQAQGFIEMRPGKETRVTMIRSEDISKIFAPLSALQSLAAELATPVMTGETIALLYQINESFARCVREGYSFAALKLDEQFHQKIVETADNPYISSMVSTLEAHCTRLYYIKSVVPAHTSIEEHEQMIRAFERRDAEAAAAHMQRNWQRAVEDFHSRLQE